jgi:hypothetical protein
MTVAAVAVISRNKTWKSSFSNEEFEKGMRAMLLDKDRTSPDSEG